MLAVRREIPLVVIKIVSQYTRIEKYRVTALTRNTFVALTHWGKIDEIFQTFQMHFPE